MLFTGKSRKGATNTLVTTLNAVRLDLSYPIFADGAKLIDSYAQKGGVSRPVTHRADALERYRSRIT